MKLNLPKLPDLPKLPSLPKFGLPAWAKKAVPYAVHVPQKPILPEATSVYETRKIVTSGNMMCYAVLDGNGAVLRVELWVKGQKIGVLSAQETLELVALLDKAVGLPYA